MELVMSPIEKNQVIGPCGVMVWNESLQVNLLNYGNCLVLLKQIVSADSRQ